VPGRRKPRLLQEYPSERIGSMVADRIARFLAGAHSGVEKRQDVGEAAHRPMPSRNRAPASLAAAAMRSASAGSVMAATVARILANSSRARSRETR
jgi:hypothetical protein